MPNKHYRSWLVQMPLGFVFTTAAIVIIMFSIKNMPDDQWIIWAIISAVTLILGLILLGSSLIHKIKSDLIRKSKRIKMATNSVMEGEEVS
jgi:uncharacterized membrane protein HdeD (DUF308 family)